jgi:hypothetical protein
LKVSSNEEMPNDALAWAVTPQESLLALWNAQRSFTPLSRDLVDAWPWLDVDWQGVELDGDGRLEQVAVLEPDWSPVPLLWVLGLDGRLVELDACQPASTLVDSCQLIAARDLSGDAFPELVVEQRVEEGESLLSYVRVYSYVKPKDGEAPVETPDVRSVLDANDGDAARMEYARADFVEQTGDGIEDLLLSGGVQGAAAAGRYQRERIELWSFDGEALRLHSQHWAASKLRVFVLYDANAALEQGDYALAAQLYQQVVDEASLEDVENMQGEATGAATRQFAVLRLTALQLREKELSSAAAWREWFAQNYPESAYARVHSAMLEAWRASADLGAVCKAALEQASSEEKAWVLSEMGYANPRLGAKELCPFD